MAVKGVEVIDRGWDKINKLLRIMNNSFTAVGFPGDVSTSNESVGDSGGFTIASLAAVHEFGRRDESIPARPFMKNTFEKNRRRIPKFQLRLKDKVLARRLSVKQALSQLGEWYEGEIKEEIRNGNFEALSEATVLKKGSSQPLIDEGRMIGAVTHKEHIGR